MEDQAVYTEMLRCAGDFIVIIHLKNSPSTICAQTFGAAEVLDLLIPITASQIAAGRSIESRNAPEPLTGTPGDGNEKRKSTSIAKCRTALDSR